MRFAVLVLMLLAGPAALAQSEDSPRQVLDDCIASLGADTIGLEDMEEACPGLGAALQQLRIAALMPKNQQGLLTRTGLINMRLLLERYEQPPERGQISVDRVHAALESMREPAEAQGSQSWYDRFRRWLRETFDRKEEQANPWLGRWLDEHPMSQVVQLVLFYGVMLLVLVLAILIIINEVRAARAGRRKSRAVAKSVDLQGASAVSPRDVGHRGEQASAVLRALLATLVKTGRLHSAHSLTHRELMTRVSFDDSTQRESFRRVTQLAEHEIFSGKQTSREELQDAVRAGQNLHAQLHGAAT